MRRLKPQAAAAMAAAMGALMLACTPALDWRDVRPEGSAVAAQFPCKPKSQTRNAMLAGARVPMTLLSCEADGATFALSHADLGDPARVTDALVEMRSALAGNLQATASRSAALELAGMTPNPQAVRIAQAGQLPDGAAVQARAVLFARGTQVYQAVVLGATLDEAAVDIFFDSLRFPR